MNKYLAFSASALLLSGLLITGCSSSSDGGGTPAATVPANAVLIDNSATAESTMVYAVATGTTIVSAFGVETSTPLTARDIINLVFDNVQGNNQNSPAIASGVDLSSQLCITGTASGDETETATSYSASATFSSCEIASDLFFTGSITVNSTFSESGTYTNAASGNLTVVFSSGGSNTTIGFNGFNYAENGNESTGAYTITTFTYAIAPSTGGGFAVQLTQPLVGNTNIGCKLSSGQVVVTGAAGSQARGTVNSDGSVKVEYHSGDGNYIETDNSPLACLV